MILLRNNEASSPLFCVSISPSTRAAAAVVTSPLTSLPIECVIAVNLISFFSLNPLLFVCSFFWPSIYILSVLLRACACISFLPWRNIVWIQWIQCHHQQMKRDVRDEIDVKWKNEGVKEKETKEKWMRIVFVIGTTTTWYSSNKCIHSHTQIRLDAFYSLPQ